MCVGCLVFNVLCCISLILCICFKNSTDDICTSNPCENSGTCELRDGYYKCRCPPTYTGERCESMAICIHYYCITFVLLRL